MGRLLALHWPASPHDKELWPLAESAAQLKILICGPSLEGGGNAYKRNLYFFHSDSINRPLVFEIFAFEVCTDPFPFICTDRGEKLNFFKPFVLISD